jgi:hypothetical protein
MVELAREPTSVPFPSSTTQPIHYNLTSADIAGPYTMIAQASDKLSRAASDIAVPFAQKAGQDAVRVDDKGNMVVDSLPPILGDAGKAARMTMAAKMEPQIETDLLRLRLDPENARDPQKYAAALRGYREGMVGKVGLDPALQAGVGKMVDSTGAHNLRSVITDQHANQVRDELQTLQARIKEKQEQRELLAFQKGGTDTPEFRTLTGDVNKLYDQLGANPWTKTSRARIELEQKEHDDRIDAQAVNGQAVRIFQGATDKEGRPDKIAGMAAAKKFLYESYFGDKTPLTHIPVEKRYTLFSEGHRAVEASDFTDKAAIARNKGLVDHWVKTTTDNLDAFNITDWSNFHQQSATIGDIESMRKLDQFRVTHDTLSDLQKKGDMEGHARVMEQLKRGLMPEPTAPSFLRSRAVSPGLGARADSLNPDFASRLQRAVTLAEAANPGQAAKFESFGRTTAEQAEIYARSHGGRAFTAAPPGYSLHEKGIASDMRSGPILDWLHAHPEVMKSVGLEFLPDRLNDPGHIQIAGHLRHGAGPAGPLPALSPTTPQHFDTSDAASMASWSTMLNAGRAATAHDAEMLFNTLKEVSDAGGPLNRDHLQFATYLAGLGNRSDLVEKLSPILAGAEAARILAPGESTAFISNANAAIATGDPYQVAAATEGIRVAQKRDADMAASPIASARKYIDGAGTANPLNLQNPQAFGAELANRRGIKGHIDAAYKGKFGSANYLGPEESKQFAEALRHGDASTAAGLLNWLKSLPQEDYYKTIAQPDVRNAILDMTHSNNGTRMMAGYNAMDGILGDAEGSRQFQTIFGEHADGAKAQFGLIQGVVGTFGADESAAMLNGVKTAAQRTEQENLRKSTMDALGSTTPQQVATRISGGMISGGFVPVEPTQAGEMLSEWKAGVAELVANNTAIDRAKEIMYQRMAREWTKSGVNRGAVMRDAPEAVFPVLPGDPQSQWVTQQFNQQAEAILGPQFAAPVPSALGPSEPQSEPVPNWQIVGVLSDRQTHQERMEGGAAATSWRVMVMNARGEIAPLRDPKTGRERWGIDTRDMPMEPFTNSFYGPNSPEGNAYNRAKQDMQNAQRMRFLQEQGADAVPPVGPRGITAGQALRGAERLGRGALRALTPLADKLFGGPGSAVPPASQYNPATGMTGPPLDADAHAGARDGG